MKINPTTHKGKTMNEKSCDSCENRWICKIIQNFEQPLLDTRHCIKKGTYPELCQRVYGEIGKFCQRYTAQ